MIRKSGPIIIVLVRDLSKPVTALGLLVALLVVLLLTTSCTDSRIENLQEENQRLMGDKKELDSLLGNYISTLNEIEINLIEIKKREEGLDQSLNQHPDYQESRQDELIADIKEINKLMEVNRFRIDQLNEQLRSSNLKSDRFRALVEQLTIKVANKEQYIKELTFEIGQLSDSNRLLLADIDKLQGNVSVLEETNSVQKELLESQFEELDRNSAIMNTAYVATGTFKELRDEQVVTKEGGVFGLGGVEILDDDVKPESFQRIDIREISEITLTGKHATLITTHPPASYEISRNEKNELKKLIIKDPAKFWESTKYLVVVLN